VRIAEDVVRHTDTTHVYLIRRGREAIAIDFGDGSVLDHLPEYGIDRITDVLMTHHHRDSAQGLPRAVEAGIRIHVPATERDLFDRVSEHWQARPLERIYDLREDRFSLLDDVPVAGVVHDYRTETYGGVDVTTVPTPGHTPGSVSYLVEAAGRRLAFVGDLMAAAGRVPSLAATQWTYTGIEGLGATILSGLDLIDRAPDVVLPAHGEPLEEPADGIRLLNRRLQALIDLRSPDWRLAQLRDRPYLELSRHLLRNRTSVANSYVLLSETGKALVLDFGFDFTTGLPDGVDRSSRRPWLQTLPALKQQFGVDRVEVAIPTHYHDDHVAGFNLLREVEGTEVWSPEDMTDLFRHPRRYDLPCLWYDPIGVDRELRYDQPVTWHEYELRIHPLHGHTLFACAIEIDVDGRKVLATGDQQSGRWVDAELPEYLNYQYRNRFRFADFEDSAALYRRVQPDLVISGHWQPRPVTDDWLGALEFQGAELARLHRELLPLDDGALDETGYVARIEPYRPSLAMGEALAIEVIVRNPFPHPAAATVTLIVPDGWRTAPGTAPLPLPASGDATLRALIQPAARPIRRARIAADVTIDGRRFGQHAEALVDIA
jgi:glyoxylase-like metal-dependent hydrolase (beta-lactamase superfamily II)